SMVVAFGASLFLYDWRALGRLRVLMVVLAQGFFIAGIGIAMSRSALLIAALLIIVRLLTFPRARRLVIPILGVAVVLFFVLVNETTFVRAIFHRLAGGFAYD